MYQAIIARTELQHVRSQLTAMATSMGKAAMATGNHTLMEKIEGISSDCPDEEYASSMSNLLAMEMEASTSPQGNMGSASFLSVIQLAENQLKVWTPACASTVCSLHTDPHCVLQDLGSEVASLKERAALAESLYTCETDTRKKLQAQLQDAKTDRAKALRECDRSRVGIYIIFASDYQQSDEWRVRFLHLGVFLKYIDEINVRRCGYLLWKMKFDP